MPPNVRSASRRHSPSQGPSRSPRGRSGRRTSTLRILCVCITWHVTCELWCKHNDIGNMALHMHIVTSSYESYALDVRRRVLWSLNSIGREPRLRYGDCVTVLCTCSIAYDFPAARMRAERAATWPEPAYFPAYFLVSEKAEVLLRGVGTTIAICFSPNASVRWQPDDNPHQQVVPRSWIPRSTSHFSYSAEF